MCNPPKKISYGKVEWKSLTPTSVATYSCDYGYILVGEVRRTCQSDGYWGGKAPVCKQGIGFFINSCISISYRVNIQLTRKIQIINSAEVCPKIATNCVKSIRIKSKQLLI